MTDVTDLRQLVLRRLAELGERGRPLSQRDAADRSGGRISHATIGNITSGRHGGKLDDRTVDGLALALDVPRSDILRALHRTSQSVLRPFEAPERWQRLTHAQRKVVIAVGNGLLDAYEQGQDDAEERGREPLRAVARRDEGSRAPAAASVGEKARQAAAANPDSPVHRTRRKS